jgi:hypothetical protein
MSLKHSNFPSEVSRLRTVTALAFGCSFYLLIEYCVVSNRLHLKSSEPSTEQITRGNANHWNGDAKYHQNYRVNLVMKWKREEGVKGLLHILYE